tara:strand:- start:362 stop:502 length:141 start_codon:yes stop_codon:yes gene_type:complete
MVEFFITSILAVGLMSDALIPAINSGIDVAAPYVDQGVDAVKSIIK